MMKREPFGGEMGRMLMDNSAARISNKSTTSTGAEGQTTSSGAIPEPEFGPSLPNYEFAAEKRMWKVYGEDEVRQFDKYNKWSKAA
jgi:hypothetical protein